eukprot:457963_1
MIISRNLFIQHHLNTAISASDSQLYIVAMFCNSYQKKTLENIYFKAHLLSQYKLYVHVIWCVLFVMINTTKHVEQNVKLVCSDSIKPDIVSKYQKCIALMHTLAIHCLTFQKERTKSKICSTCFVPFKHIKQFHASKMFQYLIPRRRCHLPLVRSISNPTLYKT